MSALVRERGVSSVELVEAHLRQIERVNPRLNAMVVLFADQARREAQMADRATGARGPLHGVPITVKDWIEVASKLGAPVIRVFSGRARPGQVRRPVSSAGQSAPQASQLRAGRSARRRPVSTAQATAPHGGALAPVPAASMSAKPGSTAHGVSTDGTSARSGQLTSIQSAVVTIRFHRSLNQMIHRLTEIDFELGMQPAEFTPHNSIEARLRRAHHDGGAALSGKSVGSQIVLPAHGDKQPDRPGVWKGKFHLDCSSIEILSQSPLQARDGGFGRRAFTGRARTTEQRLKLGQTRTQTIVFNRQVAPRISMHV